MEIESRLKQIFVDVFKAQADKITLQTKQNELEGWDSLGQLRIIMAVEESFNITIMIEEVATLTTFERIMNKIEQNIL